MKRNREELTRELRGRVQGRLDLSRELSDGEVQALIDEEIMQKSREGYLMLEERLRLQKELFNSMRRLDMLQELIEDPEVTEIMVNGPENIFVERGGRLTRWEKSFSSKEKLEDVVQQIVSFCNRSVSKASPIADARLADRIPCQYCAGSGGAERSGDNDPPFSERTGTDAAASGMGLHQ